MCGNFCFLWHGDRGQTYLLRSVAQPSPLQSISAKATNPTCKLGDLDAQLVPEALAPLLVLLSHQRLQGGHVHGVHQWLAVPEVGAAALGLLLGKETQQRKLCRQTKAAPRAAV